MSHKIFKYLGFLVACYFLIAIAGLTYTGDIEFDIPDIEIPQSTLGMKNTTWPALNIAAVIGSDSSIYGQSEKSPSAEYYNQTYTWSYNNQKMTYSISIPGELYDYYKSQPHSSRKFDQYALSDKDRTALNKIVETFKDQGKKNGFNQDENVINIISFIQSMPYTSDSVTTGYDEYPRYPIETLADGGGDCEDTVILAAALLHEMGYGVVLLEFPGHMALGVAGSENMSGSYYEYEGVRYFYVETTASGHKIGEIPENINAETAKIHPMKKSQSFW